MTGELNLTSARLLIDQLVKQGVDYFCLSPGSRSTPLMIAIAEHPAIKTMVHFDERGTAFHALGYAKGSGRAAAILVTSGTAVGNLLPAIMEACNERIPLIVITADRPPELRSCGASQTCDQVKLFSPYVRWECDLPCPSKEIPERFLATTIAHAVAAAHGHPSGPIHLNCQFRKPLFADDGGKFPDVTPLHIELGERRIAEASLQACAKNLSFCKEGLILVGSMKADCDVKAILALSEKLQWPVLPDILSQVRSLGKHPCVVRNYETLLKIHRSFHPKTVLHFGDRLVSKVVKYWLAELKIETYIQVADHPERQDPHHLTTHRFVCDPKEFCRGVSEWVEKNEETAWINSWHEKARLCESAVEASLSERSDLSEPGIVQILGKTLSKKCALFLANSMPVRDADLFLFPDQPIGPVFGNRGVAGIDGNIATVAGIANGLKRPLIALLGDLTVLHDINSLSQLKYSPYPVLIVTINNQGGGIFSFLPIAQKKELFEQFAATAHPFTFEAAAALFQLPYQKIEGKRDWEQALEAFSLAPKTTLIEIATERESNYRQHLEITRSAAEAQMGYTACGDKNAPPLLFLHGFLGCKEDWKEVIEELSAHYFCVAIDLPGHGNTPFTSDVCAEIYAFIHRFPLVKPTLVGYSMGGRIALQLKEKYPALFPSLILFSTHPGLPTEDLRKARREEDEQLALQLEQNPLSSFLETWYNQPLFASLKHNAELFHSTLRRRIRSNPQTLAQALRAFSLGNQPHYSSFDASTHFVCGEEDLKYKAFSAYKISGTGHAVHLENPRECARIVNFFLENDHANTRANAECGMGASQ